MGSTSPVWKRTIRRPLPIAVALMLAGCSAGARCAEASTTSIVEFIRLFSDNRLSVTSATGLAGPGAVAQQQGMYWQVRDVGNTLEFVLAARGRNDATADAEVRFPDGSMLTLADLQKAFGAWRPVSISKTSSVSFHVRGRAPGATVVFARVSTSNPTSTSRVSSLQLRRNAGGGD